jgi:morphogenetic protein associated with SpoVID
MNYGQQVEPYYGIPPIPPLPQMPPMRSDRGESEDVVAVSAPAAKKRQAKPKPKHVASRQSKPKQKESLPWIKW